MACKLASLRCNTEAPRSVFLSDAVCPRPAGSRCHLTPFHREGVLNAHRSLVLRRPKSSLQPLRLIALLLIALGIQVASQAQPDSSPPIDRKTQAAIIDSVSAVLREEYVFPDVARKMEELLRKNLKDGKYTEITDPAAFAEKLGEDLRSVSHDKHLQLQHLTPGTGGKLWPFHRRSSGCGISNGSVHRFRVPEG